MRFLARGLFALVFATAFAAPGILRAETLKVLTAGAFKQVLLDVLPLFQAKGHDVQWEADTVGGLVKRIDAGETFDIMFASPAGLETIRKTAKIGATIDLARGGVGVAVKDGASKPDIASVESFRRTLLAARRIAYIDPASGGSSGIYVAGLLDRLGIGEQMHGKSVLVRGGYSADRVVSGEADLAIQQISELLAVKGVTLAGPLPADIQNYTTYSAAVAANSPKAAAAKILIDILQGPAGDAAIGSRGMEPTHSAPAN
jgi:molybdate transport system substrate-binding protein